MRIDDSGWNDRVLAVLLQPFLEQADLDYWVHTEEIESVMIQYQNDATHAVPFAAIWQRAIFLRKRRAKAKNEDILLAKVKAGAPPKKKIPPHLGEAQYHLLCALYRKYGIPTDQLPWRDEFFLLHAEFNARGNNAWSLRELAWAISNLRRSGRLPRVTARKVQQGAL